MCGVESENYLYSLFFLLHVKGSPPLYHLSRTFGIHKFICAGLFKAISNKKWLFNRCEWRLLDLCQNQLGIVLLLIALRVCNFQYQRKQSNIFIGYTSDVQSSPTDNDHSLTEDYPLQNVTRTFTLFPQLPPELRRNIWRLAIPDEGRVIPIRHYDRVGLRHVSFDISARLPPALHAIFQANQESRAELVMSSGYLRFAAVNAGSPTHLSFDSTEVSDTWAFQQLKRCQQLKQGHQHTYHLISTEILCI